MGRLDGGPGQELKATARELSGRIAEVGAILGVAAGAAGGGPASEVLAQAGAIGGLAAVWLARLAEDPPRNTWARVERADVDLDYLGQETGPLPAPLLSLARSTRAAVISIERLDGAEARLPNYRYMPFEDPSQYIGIQEHAARYFLDISARASAVAAESRDLWLDAVRRDAAVAATAETRRARDPRSPDLMRLNDTEDAERLAFLASVDGVLVRDAVELAPEFGVAAGAYAAAAAEFAGALGG